MTEQIDVAGRDGPTPARPAAEAGDAALSSTRLFPPGRTEIRIDHNGTEYRLRITRHNKLILYR